MLRYYHYNIFLYLPCSVYTSYSSLRLITYDFSNIQFHFSREKFYSIKYQKFLKIFDYVFDYISIFDYLFLYPRKIQVFEMNGRFAVTCHEGERIMHNSCRRKNGGSAPVRLSAKFDSSVRSKAGTVLHYRFV